MARRFGAEVNILHVFRFLAHHRYRMPVAWMLDQVRRDVQSKLRRLKQRAKKAGCAVATNVIESEDPASVILKETEKFERAIVVVGTHTRDPIERFFLGSTAEEVLRTTRFPVVTVGPHVKRSMGPASQSIMLATDLSERSFEPLPLLARLMTPSTCLTVVHVTDSVLATDAEACMHAVKTRMELHLSKEVMLHQVQWKIIHSADITRALVEEAMKQHSELLIMGMHRSGELNAHLPLKTGFRVIVGAPCAVLTVCS
jgi:nucleotide-binding universal stress UspA family protein